MTAQTAPAESAAALALTAPAEYIPSNVVALVPDLAPVRRSRKAERPDRTCVAPKAGADPSEAGEAGLCGAVLGKNGATRRARTGVRFCSDECQRRGRRRERHTETADYGRMAARVVASYGRRAAAEFDQLGQLAEIARQADQALRDAVAGARERGLSWALIGAQFGISRQGAEQRFGKR